MARRKRIDRHPGPVPEIRIVDESLVFEFACNSSDQCGRLLIRCDDGGEIFVSIPADQDAGAP
jgi:hypothetical protein